MNSTRTVLRFRKASQTDQLFMMRVQGTLEYGQSMWLKRNNASCWEWNFLEKQIEFYNANWTAWKVVQSLSPWTAYGNCNFFCFWAMHWTSFEWSSFESTKLCFYLLSISQVFFSRPFIFCTKCWKNATNCRFAHLIYLINDLPMMMLTEKCWR